jgi:hypothetical protein
VQVKVNERRGHRWLSVEVSQNGKSTIILPEACGVKGVASDRFRGLNRGRIPAIVRALGSGL